MNLKPQFLFLTVLFVISCKPIKFMKTDYYTRAEDPYGFFGTISICDSTNNYHMNDWHKDNKSDFGKYQNELGVIEPYVNIELNWKNDLFKNDIKTLKDIIRSKLMNEYGIKGYVKNGIDHLKTHEKSYIINKGLTSIKTKVNEVKFTYNPILFAEKPKNKLNIFLDFSVFTTETLEGYEGGFTTYIVDSEIEKVIYTSIIGINCDLRDLDHLNYVIDYSLNKIGLKKVN